MILTGDQIREAVEIGDIAIDPFNTTQLNPNSYNYLLGDELIEISSCRDEGRTHNVIVIEPSGHLLQPNKLYLGCTLEYFSSPRYVMTLLGRSSMGRLGLFLNFSSDLGHVGSRSRWTLEMKVVQPLRIYPRMKIGQLAFWLTYGPASPYRGKYLDDVSPMASKEA